MVLPTYDILGIGNAIVDVVARAEDSFLSRHDMHKGAMILIDAAAADQIYAAMPPGQESSGGSAANTCAVAAGLGSRVAYIGKVAAANKTTIQLSADISRALEAGGYYSHPIMSVEIVAYASRYVTVLGDVSAPSMDLT